MRQIVIDILDTGEVKLQTIGYRGHGCTEDPAVVALKKIIGTEVERDLTPAYMETEEGEAVTVYLPLCG